jgi:hypothetical protein
MAISSSGSGSSQSSAFSQPTLMSVLDDPRLGNLFQDIQGATPRSLPSLDSIVQEGMNSPLMSQIISGALARAAPNEALARQGVTDAARGAGGLRGTAYMQNVARNEGNILDQRGILTSDIVAKTLQQLISGRLQEQQNSFLPARTLTDLFQAGRPLSGQTSSSQSTSNYGNQSGGAGDYYSDNFMSQYRNSPSPFGISGGGGGQTGVNSGAGSNISAPTQTAANPYGGYGFGPGGGAPTYATGGAPQGNYNWTANQGGNTNTGAPQSYGPSTGGPQYGPWQNATPGVPGTGTWAGYPQQQPAIFGNFPAPVPYDNPYAGWEPAEPVPWISQGGEY